MTTEQRLMQSIFPDLPREIPAIDKEGNFTALWDLGISALFQALQDNYKNEGIRIPILNQTSINSIATIYSSYIGGDYTTLTKNLPDISGQTVYNTSTYFTNQFVIAQDFANPSLVTMAQWVPLAVQLTYAGNPNGHVAGNLNYLCYDTVDVVLYVCTTAGNAASAVWSSV